MKTKATVIKTDGRFATVETERTSACDGCHKSEEGGCSVCSLMGSNRKIETRAENSIGAAVGETVYIESQTGRMLWYGALVFLMPLIATILGWVIVSLITPELLWQFFGGVFGFVAAFTGIYIYARAVKNKRVDVVITERIATKQEDQN